ncbi:MAG TPA: hypothetical protein VIL20_12550 [Sandaracinaceae bacterium]
MDGVAKTPRRWRGAAWLLFLALAVVEVVGHVVVRARVVDEPDWEAAAARVRRDFREGDLVVVAPEWADPILRLHLGDVISLEAAGRSDLSRYERLWALSIRGHLPPEAPAGAPELDEQVGRVRVLRWTLRPDRILYDFVEHVEDARVTMVQGGREIPCPWRNDGRARGGGLGAGPIVPAARHVCDPRRPWLWVGATMQDDLDLRPRWCVWQHPAGPEPIRTTFDDVPLGERVVLYADLYYEHERDREHGPVHVAVRVDGEEIGRMIHADGDGWKRLEASTQRPGGPRRERGRVSIEVSAPDPHLRTICWAATTRGEAE